MKVSLQIAYKGGTPNAIPQAGDFQRWGDCVEEFLQKPLSELCVRIVDSAESCYLNQCYLHKAKPTNVLAFPCGEQVPDEFLYLGDVVLDAEVIQQEAAEQFKQGLSHWAHMFVHGTLHLYGFDHQQEPEAQRMQHHEIAILKHIGFANPYADTPSHATNK